MRKITLNERMRCSQFPNDTIVILRMSNNSCARLVKRAGSYYFISKFRELDGAKPDNFSECVQNNSYSYSWVLSQRSDNDRISCIIGEINRLLEEKYIDNMVRLQDQCEYTEASMEDKFINNNYEKGFIYSGQHGYHHSHDLYFNRPLKDNSEYKIGVELEVECKSSDKLLRVQGFKSNWFTMEKDSSLGSYGVEFVTIPMKPKDIKSTETWQDFIETLSPLANSWNTGRCGLHVHIGRESLGKTAEQQSETLGKMLFLYHHFLKDTDLNVKIYGRQRAYNDHDGKADSAIHVAALGTELLKIKSIKEKVDKDLKAKSNTARYFDINIQNVNTIEFRKGRGSINVDRIISVITYSEFIVKYSRQISWTKISYESFFEYVKTNVKKDSPLRKYFHSQEEA